jgi:SpoVK/Ycf46/Vps4 family AAA+-type ATPase
MNNINTIRTMERMNNIIDELKQLQKDFDDLFKENEKEAIRESYINTREYYWMVIIRQRLGIWLSYEEMKQFMNEAEDRSIDFGTKDPWIFTDDEIVEEFETFYRC